jgi:hypothetical protein
VGGWVSVSKIPATDNIFSDLCGWNTWGKISCITRWTRDFYFCEDCEELYNTEVNVGMKYKFVCSTQFGRIKAVKTWSTFSGNFLFLFTKPWDDVFKLTASEDDFTYTSTVDRTNFHRKVILHSNGKTYENAYGSLRKTHYIFSHITPRSDTLVGNPTEIPKPVARNSVRHLLIGKRLKEVKSY